MKMKMKTMKMKRYRTGLLLNLEEKFNYDSPDTDLYKDVMLITPNSYNFETINYFPDLNFKYNDYGNHIDYSIFKFNESPDLTNIKTIFINKKCKIYSIKLKAFLKKYNIKKVSDPNEADYFVIDKSHLQYNNKISNLMYKISCKRFLERFEKDLINNHPNIVETVKNSKCKFLFINGNIKSLLSKEYLKLNESTFIHTSYEERIVDLDLFKRCLKYEAAGKFIEPKYLISAVNNLNPTITKESYEQLDSMFTSDDPGSQSLAMEIMANSNYNANLVYILELIDKHYPILQNEKKNLNFKSLLQYIPLKCPTALSMEYKLSLLKEHDQLTLSNIKLLIPNIDHGR